MSQLTYENIQDIYELSPMQAGMYFHYLYDKTAPIYLEQMSYRLQGSLKIPLVEASLRQLVKRYDVLRTIFNHEQADLPLQVVLKERDLDFHYEDIRMYTQDAQEEYICHYRALDRGKPFNLNKDVLMRVAIFQLQDEEFEFIWTHHHILMDGWCLSILISDFMEIYQHLQINQSPQLPSTEPYKRYIEWLGQQDKEAPVAFWRKYLAGYEEAAVLPKTKGVTGFEQQECGFSLAEKETGDLRVLAGRMQATVSTLIQAAWGLILSTYTGQRDVVFGTVVAGRPTQLPGVETMVGLFINTIPVRVTVQERQAFADVVRTLQAHVIESQTYHYYPLAELQAQSLLKSHLLDHILVFENYPLIQQIESRSTGQQTAARLTRLSVFEQTNYDLTVLITGTERLTVTLQYNRLAFSPEFMQRVCLAFQTLLTRLSRDGDDVLEQLIQIPRAEQEQILAWNMTAADFPQDKTLVHLFVERVRQNPGQTAAVGNGMRITYQELNMKANSIARVLKARGVTRNSVVGIIAERSMVMLIGIFGILKAGAAYLPLDPAYPQSRIRYMLEHSQAVALLTQERFLPWIDQAFEPVNLDDAALYADAAEELEISCCPDDLAYVIYTSGSTGRPKGVMVEHRAIVNRLSWMQDRYPLHTTDRILHKTPFTFDVSVWELFWWVLAGASAFLLPHGYEKFPQEIIAAVEEQKITVMHFVPSMFTPFLQVVEEMNAVNRLERLRLVFASGEALPRSTVSTFNHLLHARHGARLVNLYGPTEATVDVSYFDCSPEPQYESVPIGKPIANMQLFIFQGPALLPIGVPGELCIVGVGLARGYLNDEALTREKFVAHPLFPDQKMYRTGDLARWLPDGDLEFLGRLDHQVKIRGFRIELDEIVYHLLQLPAISQAVVLAYEINGQKQLVAYVVANEAELQFSSSAIKESLALTLPAYMIPTYIMLLDTLPLLTNGKVDRKALPHPELPEGSGYIAPASVIEHQIADLWADVLQIPKQKISSHDNFFDIGGNSLNVITVNSKLTKLYQREIPLVDMFHYTTINLLAKMLEVGPKEEALSDDDLDASLSLMQETIGNLWEIENER